MRRQASGSPPTKITSPRCCRRVRAPVPHVERVHAVVGVRRPVQVAVPLVLGVALLEAPLDLDRVGRLAQHLLVEVHVGRVVHRVELARDRVGEDHHAALAHERDAVVEVEEVPEPHAHDEDRVEDRVDVVRAEVGQPGGDDVRLPAHADGLLRGAVLERHLVHRLDRARGHARHRVRRRGLVERGPAQLRVHPVGRALQRREGRLLTRRPARLGLGEERQRPVEHVVVERRLDVEDRDGGLDDVALAAGAVVQLGLARVHERLASGASCGRCGGP